MKKPGSDGVHADALARPRRCQLARQTHQTGFGRGVWRIVRPVNRSVHPRNRRDVDDPAPLALEHVAPRGLGAKKCPRQIDVDDLLPLFERHVFRLGGPRDAGVVDQDVDFPERRDRLVNQGLDVGGPGDVADFALDAEASRPHRRDGRREPLLAARAEHERRACFREPFGHFLADATRPAGHDGGPAGEGEQFIDGWHVGRLILPTRQGRQPDGR